MTDAGFLFTVLQSGVDTLLDYLSAHVLLCLVPAFFISGAFNALIPNTTILKYMGGAAGRKMKAVAYAFAALSGLVIEVCSCTILPLFAGIWKKGAGFGPAITFLFAGPGITLLSTPLEASILGVQFAVVKLILSIVMAVAVGVTMELIFREKPVASGKPLAQPASTAEGSGRKGYQSALFFASLILVMVAGTAPIDLMMKYALVATFAAITAIFAYRFYQRGEIEAWLRETLNFTKTIFPILLLGVFVSGILKPIIPQELIATVAGENTLTANLAAALFGTIAYFPTLVEVPVAKMFLDLGMHQGPLMTYLLVDPVVSLQTLFVVNTIIGPKKTATYAALLFAYGILGGYAYGLFV
jgi:uncharacterized protein